MLVEDGRAATETRPVPTIGALEVDVAARRASVAGRPVPLRAKEFDLLARPPGGPDATVSRDTHMADRQEKPFVRGRADDPGELSAGRPGGRSGSG